MRTWTASHYSSKTPGKQEPRTNLNLSFAIEIALKSTLILTAAFGLTRLLAQASASLRHLLRIFAIIGILALPTLTRITPEWTAPKTAAAIQYVGIPQAAPAQTQPAEPETAPFKAIQWIWISGALLVLARLAAGSFRTWQLSRASTRFHLPALVAGLAAELNVRRSARVLEGGPVVMPMTWGLFRPTILMPKNGWPIDRLRVVLAHELVHVKRLDYLTQLLSQLACAFYWWNPLVWLAAAQLRQERERACDDGVLRLGANAPAYAEQLVELARLLRTAGAAGTVAVAMANPSHLEKRIVALLDRSRNRQPISRHRAAAAAIAAICFIVPLAALKARAQAAKGTISGTVYDASRAAVPGASVIASNLDTKTKETSTSDATGGYHFRQVPTGRYEVEVKKRGFAPFRQTNLVLTADAPLAFDPTLEIGGVVENVEVVATSPNRRPPSVPPSAEQPRRTRIGGNVQATKLISQVKPMYPENAQRGGIEGTVLLHAVIATDGSLLSIGVTNTLADPELAAAAIDAVKQWRYQPTLLNGEPVEVVTTISVNYRLSRE